MITKSDAKKYWSAGKSAKATGKSLENAINDYFGYYSDWSSLACFSAGYRGIEFQIREYIRYRDIRSDPYSDKPMPSYNRMDDRPERGVSVIYEDWAKTVHGMMYIANAEDKGYKQIKVHGLPTGYRGGDGEPLIIPVEV